MSRITRSAARRGGRAPAGDSVSGRVAATISCSASVIRPEADEDAADRAEAAVLARDVDDDADEDQSGESHERSNEKTTAITLVPTSAPSMTASAALVVTRFLPTNEATIRHGRRARLDDARHAEAGDDGAEAVGEAGGEDAAQVLAEHPQHAGADDVRAPDEERDRGEKVEERKHLGDCRPQAHGSE
jgi:hypothetical protein